MRESHKAALKASGSISGIYSITNTVNNKQYVGQTSDIDGRWKRHRFDLKHHYHSNKHLQSAWDKYGESSFIFAVLEVCPLEQLDDKEEYWIKRLNSFHGGYNLSECGSGCRGYKHNDVELKKMRMVQHPQPVFQIAQNGFVIAEWESASQAAKQLSLSLCGIKACCEKVHHQKSIGGYFWVYANSYDPSDMSYYFTNKKKVPTRVLIEDLSTHEIHISESLSAAADFVGSTDYVVFSIVSGKRKSSLINGYSIKKA